MSQLSCYLCFVLFGSALQSVAETAEWNPVQPDTRNSVINPQTDKTGFAAVPGISVAAGEVTVEELLSSAAGRDLAVEELPVSVTDGVVSAEELPLEVASGTVAIPELPLSVEEFENAVLKQVSASTSLQRVFTVMNPAEGRDAHFDVVRNLMQRVGVKNPYDYAWKSLQTVGNFYTTINSFQHTLAAARSIGKYLLQQGALTPENAPELATRFVNELSSLINVNNIDSDSARINLIGKGFFNLVGPLGIFGPDTASSVIEIYDQELPVIARNSKRVFDEL